MYQAGSFSSDIENPSDSFSSLVSSLSGRKNTGKPNPQTNSRMKAQRHLMPKRRNRWYLWVALITLRLRRIKRFLRDAFKGSWSSRAGTKKRATASETLRLTNITMAKSIRFRRCSSLRKKITVMAPMVVRSEERRVGKECRLQWWAYH